MREIISTQSAGKIGTRRKLPGGTSPLFAGSFVLAFSLVVVFVLLWMAGYLDPRGIQLRFSEPYRLMQNLARTDGTVLESIGSISGFGVLPRGQMDVSGREGWCEIEVSVSGTRGRGQLEARLVRHGDRWFWQWANLRMEDGHLYALVVP